jgi:hypothetical protein
MQAQGAARAGGGGGGGGGGRVGTIPRRGGRWLEALLTVAAILVIVALMALMTRGMVAPPADTGGVGAQDAKAGVVGSATVHDDAGTVHSGLAPGYAPVHDDAGNMPLGTGSAIVHDDAGNMPATGAGSAIIHDDAGNVR